jgi:ALG6, ALG8 glycosyltransferase family
MWLQRLAPLKRGLYEDYVANFWCSTHFLINWKRMFSQASLVRLCLGASIGLLAGPHALLSVHSSVWNCGPARCWRDGSCTHINMQRHADNRETGTL